MPLKKICSVLSMLFLLHSLDAQETATTSVTLNKVRLDFKLDAKGSPVYSVYFNQQPVIQPSQMGFILIEDSLMDRNFELEFFRDSGDGWYYHFIACAYQGTVHVFYAANRHSNEPPCGV